MATAFAPKISAILMTPDPHYLPGLKKQMATHCMRDRMLEWMGCGLFQQGCSYVLNTFLTVRYGGHCPRYKFTLGQTYGKLTGQLLSSPEMAPPGRRLLQPNRCLPGRKELDATPAAPGSRAVPGYTGFIPRAQDHFGRNYSEILREAREELTRQMEREAGRRQAWQVAGGGRPPAQEDTKPGSQLPPVHQKATISRGAAPYVSRWAFQAQASPYSLEEGNPQKHFIPGFTGFVPRARYLIGASYPVITHRALAEFDRMRLRRERAAASEGRAEQLQEEGGALPLLANTTCPTERGLLPHSQEEGYYVPGSRWGQTNKDKPLRSLVRI